MSLHQWADNAWICPHRTSPQEIQDLLAKNSRYDTRNRKK